MDFDHFAGILLQAARCRPSWQSLPNFTQEYCQCLCGMAKGWPSSAALGPRTKPVQFRQLRRRNVYPPFADYLGICDLSHCVLHMRKSAVGTLADLRCSKVVRDCASLIVAWPCLRTVGCVFPRSAVVAAACDVRAISACSQSGQCVGAQLVGPRSGTCAFSGMPRGLAHAWAPLGRVTVSARAPGRSPLVTRQSEPDRDGSASQTSLKIYVCSQGASASSFHRRAPPRGSAVGRRRSARRRRPGRRGGVAPRQRFEPSVGRSV